MQPVTPRHQDYARFNVSYNIPNEDYSKDRFRIKFRLYFKETLKETGMKTTDLEQAIVTLYEEPVVNVRGPTGIVQQIRSHIMRSVEVMGFTRGDIGPVVFTEMFTDAEE